MTDVTLETIYLWDGDAPGAKGAEREDRPRLYVVRPEPAKANGSAMVVCPGGGYTVRAMDYEGLQVARLFARAGMTAFILCYRIKGHGYEPGDTLVDARRAVRTVRHRAEEYGIDPERVAMLGFSAGGHLIASLVDSDSAGDPSSDDPVERQLCHTNAALYIYAAFPAAWPVGNPPDRAVPGVAATPPPSFIFHTTQDDLLKTGGALEHYRDVRETGVEVEMHIFGGWGPHGIGMATGVPSTREWPGLALSWLRRIALLTAKTRVAVKGTVHINGATPSDGWVTLIPADSDSDPIAVGRIGSLEDVGGGYVIAAKDGPVPGHHRIEVRQTGARFDTEPSMDDEAVYPDAGSVEITEGDNTLDIEIEAK